MVMSFRVSDLQVLLGFAGQNRSGTKPELLAQALQLLRSSCGAAVHMKIKELYRRRFPRKPLVPPDLAALHGPGTPRDVCHLPYERGAALSAALLPVGKREAEAPLPVHPDVTMRSLPFYDVYDELIRPTTLG
ncbi:PIAS1 ligase, partial [Columbina picui]|nr:PIAS1 ligase [Columbina picui]